MSIVFRYKQISRPGLPPRFCPSISVTFAGKQPIKAIALLDSGADYCAMPHAIAESLGMDISGKRETIRGIGGKIEAVESKTAITVEKGHERYTIDAAFKVVFGLEDDFPILLGRKDFFESFRITFDEKERKVTLKKN